ncbi:hypothetical protein E3P86_03299 [Wallemia ichthyophaga]|uniref:HTH La-type RNA-binding domain-containing protein n=1 Tax=Wallemia ichthyophaga TaxID=245174 RepID=A0A4T0IQ48_WALIC|nr:hypothetical protein E3P86_03299 [Wallemia ichthyophaga]
MTSNGNVWESRQAIASPASQQDLLVKDEISWPSASDANDKREEEREEKKDNKKDDSITSTRRGKKNWVSVPVEQVLPVQPPRSNKKSSSKSKAQQPSNKQQNQRKSSKSKNSNPHQSNQRKSSNRRNQKNLDKNPKDKAFPPVVPPMPSSFQMFGAPNSQAGHTYAPMPMPTPVTTTNYPLDPLRFYLLGQLEYYFTTQNLVRDFFLRQQMDSDGWVDIPVFTTFNRVKALSVDVYLLRDVFAMSQLVEVFFFAGNQEPSQKEEGVLQKESLDMSQVQKEIDFIASNTNPAGKVRLAHGVWKKWVLPNAQKSNVDVESLPQDDNAQFDDSATPVEASNHNEQVAAMSAQFESADSQPAQSNEPTNQSSHQNASSNSIDGGSSDAIKESK